ncbi:MAG TPA: cation:proton antiporter [Candidatus Dormibacteraeota bacterium]|nr:cation:proton antiporter [Candidatus Dormibacteraeota bacterium]
MTAVRQWPWPFLLLLAGAAVATFHGSAPVLIASSIVLVVFLPPLLFDAGFSLGLEHLFAHWRWIALFGLAGALMAAAFTFCLLFLLRFPVPLALLLSALLAATDPVSVFSALRRSTPPPRLRVTLEGESLANDAVAVVLTAVALGIIDSGQNVALGVPLLFMRLTLIGVAVGLLLGALLRRIVSHVSLAAAIVATVPFAYVAYLASDHLGGSGLLAVIVCAVVAGSGTPAGVKSGLQGFWRWVGAAMAALVFLLIGLEVRVDVVASLGLRLVGLYLAVTLSRVLMVFVLTRGAPNLWPWRWQAALTWAGLRGALSLALALSVPARLTGRAELVALTAGFILLSSTIQGLFLSPVFRRLGISGVDHGLSV